MLFFHYKLSIVLYQLSINHYQLTIVNYQLSIINCPLSIDKRIPYQYAHANDRLVNHIVVL
jgi:hypothetical protein